MKTRKNLESSEGNFFVTPSFVTLVEELGHKCKNKNRLCSSQNNLTDSAVLGQQRVILLVCVCWTDGAI